jgi:hypothetical protein
METMYNTFNLTECQVVTGRIDQIRKTQFRTNRETGFMPGGGA